MKRRRSAVDCLLEWVYGRLAHFLFVPYVGHILAVVKTHKSLKNIRAIFPVFLSLQSHNVPAGPSALRLASI